MSLSKQGSSSESPETESEEQEDFEDIVSIFGVGLKEISRAPKQVRLEDLSARQVAVCLCNLTKHLPAAELMAVGGETAPCLYLLTILSPLPAS